MAEPVATVVLASAITKLIAVIEEENDALRERLILTHAGFTDRKNQALRELMAAQRREVIRSPGPEFAFLLRRLSEALGVNTRLLKDHIAAVGEVSDIIVACIRESESDGTYTRGFASRHGS